VILLLLQRQRQPCGGNGTSVNVSHAAGCDSMYPTTPAGRVCSSVSGRSPSLVAMERVMPKYASWASSSDAAAACWHQLRDRKKMVNDFSPLDGLVQPEGGAVGSPCRNRSVGQLPAAAGCSDAGAGTLGLMSGDVMTALTGSCCDNGSSSSRSDKHELRAHLSHRPASSSAVCDVSQVGKTILIMSTTLLTLPPLYHCA